MSYSYRRLSLLVVALIVIGLLPACSVSNLDNDPAGVPPNTAPTPAQQGFPATFPAFDTVTGIIPLPNDILRNPQTGFNNFPDPNPVTPEIEEPVASMNSLRGFSTLGTLIIPFDGLIFANSVNNNTIQVFNAATGAQQQMVFQVSDNGTDSVVVASPILPLADNTPHIVVITSGVISSLSNSPVISSNFINLFLKPATPIDPNNPLIRSLNLTPAQLAQLEALRQAYQPVWQGAEALTGTSRTDIPLAFGFTTQNLYETLQGLIAQATGAIVTGRGPRNFQNFGVPPGLPTPVPLATTPAAVDAVFNGFEAQAGIPPGTLPNNNVGSIWAGSLQVTGAVSGTPWFLPAAIQDIVGFWADPPVDNGNPRGGVDFLLFFPTGAVNGVVMYQHGITVNKFTMFLLADSFNQGGFVFVGVDLPDHGQFNPGVDVLNNQTGLPPADGIVDGDGSHFISLNSPRRGRDNGRQAVVDLAYLARMIRAGTSQIPGMPPLGDPRANPLLEGHSLGGMTATVYTAVDAQNPRCVNTAGGGRVLALLLNSATFGPRILAGLAAQGIQPGTSRFAQAILIFQTVFDDSDPMNYAQFLRSGALRTNLGPATPGRYLLQEMINDQVVPNSATTDLADAAGLDQVVALVIRPLLNQVTAPYNGGFGYFQFDGDAVVGAATHSSLLTPPGPTAAIRTQLINFLGTGVVVNAGQRALPEPPNVGPIYPFNATVFFGG
ncbi:MAG: hypothetical protein HY319_29920 [Armatimonadetes bacterium]|nr:hypothetical protein [Armatimonadota bacterium]